MVDPRDIIAEPYANGCHAVGKILFLANAGDVLEPGQLLCVHTWHWPDDRELQELEPHVTYVEPGRFRIVSSWRKQVGDVIQEGERIGTFEPTEFPDVREPDDSSQSWNEQWKERERRAAVRLAIQLGIDLSRVEPTGDQGAVTTDDVRRSWEKTQGVVFQD